MTQSRQETFDWYDEADALEAPREPMGHGSRFRARHFGWWLASFAFSATWLLETRTATPAHSLMGALVGSVWGLLLSLAICFGMYRFSVVQSRPLAHVLTVVSAAVLLLNHILVGS
jgi:hypothetical protein